MDGQDSLFFLIVIYCIVLLQAADDAIADELLSLYFQQAFYHSGGSHSDVPGCWSKSLQKRVVPLSHVQL